MNVILDPRHARVFDCFLFDLQERGGGGGGFSKSLVGRAMFAEVCLIPQTVLALRGSYGVGIEGAMVCVCVRIRPWSPPHIFVAIYSTW